MGLFSSGVGKRSRRAAQAMSLNEGHRFNETQDILNKGFTAAEGTVRDAFGKGQGYLADAFKGAQGTVATGQTNAERFLQAGMAGAMGLNEQARGDLITGRDAALRNLTGPGGALSSIQGGYADALAALQQRYGQAAGQGQQAVDAFDPLLQQGMSGLTKYSDLITGALGAGGADQRQAAVDAFQAGPGYQWQVDQAAQAAQRAANRTGSASSGNAMDAVTRLSSNLANQEYGSWIDRLTEQQTGYRGQTQNATTGRAAALTNLAQLYQQQAGAESGLATTRGQNEAAVHSTAAGVNQTAGQNLATNSNAGGSILTQGNTALATNATNYAQLLAGLQTQYGQDQTNLHSSFGGTMAGLQTGKMAADAQNVSNKYNAFNQHLGIALQGGNAQGQETASWGKALIGGIGQIAGLGVSGGGTLGGNFLSSLFK